MYNLFHFGTPLACSDPNKYSRWSSRRWWWRWRWRALYTAVVGVWVSGRRPCGPWALLDSTSSGTPSAAGGLQRSTREICAGIVTVQWRAVIEMCADQPVCVAWRSWRRRRRRRRRHSAESEILLLWYRNVMGHATHDRVLATPSPPPTLPTKTIFFPLPFFLYFFSLLFLFLFLFYFFCYNDFLVTPSHPHAAPETLFKRAFIRIHVILRYSGLRKKSTALARTKYADVTFSGS